MNRQQGVTIGAHDAEAHFSELLERVAAGEVITITRGGSAVARLVPVEPVASVETRRDAIREMRELARRHQLAGLRIRDLIAEGRK